MCVGEVLGAGACESSSEVFLDVGWCLVGKGECAVVSFHLGEQRVDQVGVLGVGQDDPVGFDSP